MRKIKLVIAYDGTDFSGFQAQPGERTIQGTLEEALSALTGEEIRIYGSGRTDAGVHALGQVCHFSTSSPIPVEKYPYILRRMLPRDIVVISCAEVDFDFHARKSAYWKTYRYQIDTNPVPDLFMRRFRTHLPFPVDLSSMQAAADRFLGTHDFTSFCSTKTFVTDKVRTIYQCRVKQESGGFSIEVTGSGFLYNMVRIIAGTLYEVGRGQRSAGDISDILAERDRTLAGPTFPPEGLLLVEVGYQPWEGI
ncbi:tRNA pseudouridine(38-40) synthase TruA [Paenactinomyces guangxiensis]|uniref:tRNA pseudouridine synthase A n=1 Tax=Paenactinomyces guangxiensis TaxID=1490290 RepID=A0A7W1WTR7_9BACL|nr:tRNA pseudouridine(38-40) synthase TruA [Paenactinomyces guangxiensis]MBA4495921.1 tRNA pseudouridine(38-40) synthase TruA [Paenactinomyces guangxiensis]MBH8592942.1 tRNA pseudouridine(38-40) synthase TruA [Paenactinomyces guangxiensis]